MRTPQRARYRALLPRCADTAASARRRHQLLGHRNGVPHLHRDWAHRCHICTRTGLTPATSAQGLGPSQPHLHRDWARSCNICTGTWLIPAISAPELGSFLPHLHQDWAHSCNICTGTRLAAATSAGTGSRYRSSFAASSTASHRTTSQSRKGSRTRCISAHPTQPHARRSLEQH